MHLEYFKPSQQMDEEDESSGDDEVVEDIERQEIQIEKNQEENDHNERGPPTHRDQSDNSNYKKQQEQEIGG